MSDGEIGVTIVSVIVTFMAWSNWFFRILQVAPWSRTAAPRSLLLSAPLVAGTLLFAALRTLSAHDVRDDATYLGMYAVMGAAWVALSLFALPLVGMSTRDDALERENVSAALVVVGALFGVTCCFIGGNIGDGPGWWVVVFSAGLATLSLFFCWFVLEALGGVSDSVTIDRDPASGIRVAAFLIACGLVFGRGAAGTWVSSADTVRDFALLSGPMLLILVAAVAVERVARPSPERPVPSLWVAGVLPALLYLAAAVFILLRAGMPV